MNHVVATFAPKNQHLSTSSSLNTRVALAVGTQIEVHLAFCNRVLGKFNIDMYPELRSYLERKDTKREKHKEIQSKGETKLKRSEDVRNAIKREMAQDEAARKEGKTYQSSSGADLKKAKKALAESMKNRKKELKDGSESMKVYKN